MFILPCAIIGMDMVHVQKKQNSNQQLRTPEVSVQPTETTGTLHDYTHVNA